MLELGEPTLRLRIKCSNHLDQPKVVCAAKNKSRPAAQVRQLKMNHFYLPQREIWGCEKCKNVFFARDSQYLICPTCLNLCFQSPIVSRSLGAFYLSRDSIGERQIPWGIEPSENDLLNTIESEKQRAPFGVIRKSDLYLSTCHTIANLRIHAFRAALKNELNGMHPELKIRRIDNAQILALNVEPCDFLADVLAYLSEYKKIISMYDLIPISKWGYSDLEHYISAKIKIDPELNKEKERESISEIKKKMKTEWQKDIKLLEASTKFETLVGSTLMPLFVISITVSLYIFFELNWIYAIIFGFISLKIIAYLNSFISSRKYYRRENWKRDHPAPVDF
jgi:hypothetical protein